MRHPGRFSNFRAFTSVIALLIFISACTLSETGKKKSTGASGELLVVTNDKTQWEGLLGDTIRAFFTSDYPGLSQPEPLFDLLNIASADMGDIFKKFHNILIVDIQPAATQTISERIDDLWSAPQVVIRITASDETSFFSEFDRNKELFLDYFEELERKRTLELNSMANNIKLSSAVERKFNISLPLPGGFYMAKESTDFMWLRHKVTKAKQDVELSILIYSMDYRDTVVFNPRHVIQWRNNITLEHVPGPSPLSFMKASVNFIPPVFDTVTGFPGGFAVETRGLWEVENDFMGGPFISYTFADTIHQKVITLDGYVFYPNNDKRDYLRNLEAIFHAAKVTGTGE
jgi:hypothetical protein